jgi:hypothetical protein
LRSICSLAGFIAFGEGEFCVCRHAGHVTFRHGRA